MGLPPGLSDVAMYCRQAKLKLPLKSIIDLKIYISPLDVDLIGCFNGASCQWGGGYVQIKPSRGRPRNGAHSIHSLFGEFMLLGK